MQLSHRTVSFIIKGLKQAPTQQDTHTHMHTVSSDVLMVTSDKQQSGRSGAAECFPHASVCSASTTLVINGVPHVSTRRDLHRRSKKTEQVKKNLFLLFFMAGAFDPKLFFFFLTPQLSF